MKEPLIPAESLRAAIPWSILPETTEIIQPAEGMIGQERADRAIRFGLEIRDYGYNIFVAGPAGTGKMSSVEAAVRKLAETLPTPCDFCYVYNFSKPDQPMVISMAPGLGHVFQNDMNRLTEELKIEIRRAFESKIYEEHKTNLIKEFQKEKEEIFTQVEESAKQAGFQIKQTPGGIVFLPLVEGQPLSEEDLEKLTDGARREIRSRQEAVYEVLAEALRRVREKEKLLREKLEKLDRETGQAVTSPRLSELRDKYKDYPEILKWLAAVEQDIVTNLEDFQEKKEPEVLPGLRFLGIKDDTLQKYRVNVFVDHSRTKGAPVIKEVNPTAYNLTGRIEYRPHLGAMFTDHTMIKPGALHLANGGFLILRIADVLHNYFAWDALKRALQNREVVPEDINEQFRLINTPTIKPEPIPLNIKVVLIGNLWWYYLLYHYDEDFRKLFKVRADFALFMERNNQEIMNYCAFVSKICREEKLAPFDREAIGEIIQFGSRLVEDQTKLTTRFSNVADLLREANYWARKDSSRIVRAVHVKKALEEKYYRSRMIEDILNQMIKEGTIMVDTTGMAVGQVNGLSVMALGDYTFGKPTRVTARIGIGRGHVINIEREVKLAGTIHNKGFLILTGYLREKYGVRYPLSFSASICFEQVYEEIEGDSASTAELYVLLSSLSGLPLKQSIAVTGSVNQHGQVQQVGGINENIEGFFLTCQVKGPLNGQGVIIPRANLKNLMLKEELVQAVKEG
ncbi:MAG: AAA family ATPase, partial [Candidatus Omnitrophica bacterium]|nr:AAA family ATPase [Candidatus Omnitrophota bacterium]